MVASNGDFHSAPLLSSVLQPTVLWRQGAAPETTTTRESGSAAASTSACPTLSDTETARFLSVDDLLCGPIPTTDPAIKPRASCANEKEDSSLRPAPKLNPLPTSTESSSSPKLNGAAAIPDSSKVNKPIPNGGSASSSTFKKSAHWKSEQKSTKESRESSLTEDYRQHLGKTFGRVNNSANHDAGSGEPASSSARKTLKNNTTKKASRKDDEDCLDQLADTLSRLELRNETPSTSNYDPTPATNNESTPRTDNYDPTPVDGSDAGIPVYMIKATKERLCMFDPFRPTWLQSNRGGGARTFDQGEIYVFEAIKFKGISNISKPEELRRRHYLERDRFVYGSARTYRELILPALLLGSRVRDFEQRCATVTQMYDDEGHIVLTMPAQNREMQVLELKTMTGEEFSLGIVYITPGKGGKWIVRCHPLEEWRPDELCKDAQLEVTNCFIDQPRVSEALMQALTKDVNMPVANWKLLSAIYGKRERKESPPVEKLETVSFQYANSPKSFELNRAQQDAVARYASVTNRCRAFVVEAPPGSGKTVTAAAMALSYKGPGIQLFLSTANVPVINMVLAIAKLDIGSMKVLHFISSEREEMMTNETRSPYSALSLAKQREDLAAPILQLEELLSYAKIPEERAKLKDQIQKIVSPIYDEPYNAYFGTVDTILGRLLKVSNDFVKYQLLKKVKRIVVDEASQLTEAALNALILSFPKAQIVLIGDSKQMPPYRYAKGEVVSELAARSALDVCKAKANLPVTTLKHVYRAAPTLIKHYSDVFYEGQLKSRRRETPKNPLDCFGARSDGHRCLFWEVAGRQMQSGNSLSNEEEIAHLKYIVHILKTLGLTKKDVMIISYYEAQRRKAEEELPEGYEVLTVDSAQGREKKVVIVLTTRSVCTDTGSFITCPLRCNVAVSRHQRALIVLGHNSITLAPNWSRILSPDYFKHVPPFNIVAEHRQPQSNDDFHRLG